ncbi:MAG: hypothetical protein QXU20_00070 [Candidatus Woesearchaeota archaeon]
MLEFKVKEIIEQLEELKNKDYSLKKAIDYFKTKEILSSEEIRMRFGREKYGVFLYTIGLKEQNFWIKEKRDKIIEEFLNLKHPYLLYLAGIYWTDFWFTKEITKKLIESKDPYLLYYAGLDWKAERFSEEIARTLLETKDQKYINLALKNWNKTRKEILEKYIKEKEEENIKKHKKRKK